jgi:hypothetical protein
MEGFLDSKFVQFVNPIKISFASCLKYTCEIIVEPNAIAHKVTGKKIPAQKRR